MHEIKIKRPSDEVPAVKRIKRTNILIPQNFLNYRFPCEHIRILQRFENLYKHYKFMQQTNYFLINLSFYNYKTYTANFRSGVESYLLLSASSSLNRTNYLLVVVWDSDVSNFLYREQIVPFLRFLHNFTSHYYMVSQPTLLFHNEIVMQ